MGNGDLQLCLHLRRENVEHLQGIDSVPEQKLEDGLPEASQLSSAAATRDPIIDLTVEDDARGRKRSQQVCVKVNIICF